MFFYLYSYKVFEEVSRTANISEFHKNITKKSVLVAY